MKNRHYSILLLKIDQNALAKQIDRDRRHIFWDKEAIHFLKFQWLNIKNVLNFNDHTID